MRFADMAETLIHRLLAHPGCVIALGVDGVVDVYVSSGSEITADVPARNSLAC